MVGGMAALVASIVVGPRRSAQKAQRQAASANPADANKAAAAAAAAANDDEGGAVLFGDSTLHFVGGLALWLGSYGLCQVIREKRLSLVLLLELNRDCHFRHVLVHMVNIRILLV
jgi:uncharacterized membrane protein